jgi:membrane protein implicated in regulation of membrane protease activity
MIAAQCRVESFPLVIDRLVIDRLMIDRLMIDGMEPWIGWLIAAVVLGVIELASLDLVLVMLAGGAVSAAAVAGVGGGVTEQVVVFCSVAIALLGAVRPVARRHLTRGPATRTGTEALIGQQARVVERVDAHGGRVAVGGDMWSARSYDPNQELNPGDTADIMAIDGATAVVYRLELS